MFSNRTYRILRTLCIQKRNAELAGFLFYGVLGVLGTALLWGGIFIFIHYQIVLFDNFLPDVLPIVPVILTTFLVYLVFHAEGRDHRYGSLPLPGYDTGTITEKIHRAYIPRGVFGSNVNPIGPKTVTSGARVITQGFMIGPRFIRMAFSSLHRADRLMRLPFRECTEIVEYLQQRPGRVSQDQLRKAFPMAESAGILEELKFFDGVLFLSSEPPGLSLSEGLRVKLQP